MSTCKYKVEQDGLFLGHHSGNTLQKVVQKAVEKYGPFCVIDVNKPFTLTRGFKIYQVYLEQ